MSLRYLLFIFCFSKNILFKITSYKTLQLFHIFFKADLLEQITLSGFIIVCNVLMLCVLSLKEVQFVKFRVFNALLKSTFCVFIILTSNFFK